MDDQTKDVAPWDDAGESQPSEPSQQPTEEDSPSENSELETALQRIKVLEGYVGALQSDKDKGIAKVAKEQQKLSEQFEKYEEWRKAGKSPKEAERETLVDQLLENYQAPSEPVEVPQQTPKATVASTDILSPFLDAVGLEASDPDVIEVLRKQSDLNMQIAELTKISEARKQAPPPPASPGAAMSTGGGVAVEGETIDSVRAELEAEMKKPATPAQRARVKELSEKHKEMLPKK